MAYILSEWKYGASFTKGYTPEEYFYNQILTDFKINTDNHNLPFFDKDNKSLPRELTSGKIINDENLIALEQSQAKNNYKSSIWLYGEDLKKLEKQGFKINFKPNTEPVLCMTKYKNATHYDSEELYISEGGNKNNFQFLYNYDSLDDRSKKDLRKYYEKALELEKIQSKENLNNYIKNVKNEYQTNKQNIQNIKERIRNNRYLDNIDCSSLIEAQYLHDVYKSINGQGQTNIQPEKVNNCYKALNQLFEKIDNGFSSKMVAEDLTKKLYSASVYQKTMTSKNLNMETKKNWEEDYRKMTNIVSGYER